MKTLTLLVFLALPARADDATPYTRLANSQEPAERIAACVELAKPENRGTPAYTALHKAMGGDLSERVRLAAALGALTYGGGQTLAHIDAFLKTEPGPEVRRDLLLALSTEPAHFENPDATRILISSLQEDPSPDVRLGAARGLGLRGDALALIAVGRAAEKDEDKRVREAAKVAMKILSKPTKARPKPKGPPPPKTDAVFGKDACPIPWGWCACSGAIALKAKCVTGPECREMNNEMRHRDLECHFNGSTD